jgi:hypothetical protein
MKVTSIVSSEYYHGIPIKGWDTVKGALQAFSEGKSRGARRGIAEQHKAIENSSGGMAVGLALLAEVYTGTPDRFVQQITKEAEETIKKCGSWRGSYDYDGPGPFFKSVIGIDLHDEKDGVYVLSVHVTRNEGAEEGLAEFLGVPRALLRCMVTITTEPPDPTHFTFDFKDVYTRIGLLLGLDTDVGTKIVQYMMSGDEFNDPRGFVLKEDDDLLISLSLGRVKRRFAREGQKMRDTWLVEGSVLTGLLEESYEDRTKKELPTFIITVSKKPTDHSVSIPVWDVELRQRMVNCADEIRKGMLNG